MKESEYVNVSDYQLVSMALAAMRNTMIDDKPNSKRKKSVCKQLSLIQADLSRKNVIDVET